jgi:uncharacterized membrane protein YccC
MLGRTERAPGQGWRDPAMVGRGWQLVKTAVACVLAWVIVTDLLGLPESFLAPWSALLVVHSSVYRTFAQGARQVAGALVGVVLAWAVGTTLGVDAWSVGLVVLVGLVIGAGKAFEGESTTAAATALIVLTTGDSAEATQLLGRLADTGIGVLVGLAVNVVAWPPLWRHAAASAIDGLATRIGEVAVRLAEGLEHGYGEDDVQDWLEDLRRIETEVDRAWALGRQSTESARLNPRRSAAGVRAAHEWTVRLDRAEQALADTRSMVLTVGRRPDLLSVWDRAWRAAYVDILRATGRALADGDRDRVHECRERLDALARQVVGPDGDSPLWPVYGGLLVNLRNILDSGEVLAAGPAPSRVLGAG